MYVFIIPRLIERKREYGAGCDDAVSWNRRERDVLEHFAAQYRSWLRHAARRYVNREIARIADDPVAEPVRRGGGGTSIFSSPSRSLRSIHQPEKKHGVASGASDRDARRMFFFIFYFFVFVLESAMGIFPSAGRGARGQRRIS